FSNPAAAFEAYQDQARKNMAMFEQAMSMWTSSFSGGKFQPQAEEKSEAGEQETSKDEIGELKEQLSAMQRRLERLAKDHE
ncbi:MAG TPA: polyhydroxyalkanoate synthesis repressor PhaR, partial [Hyphomicrobium sp.]|nr:polyhydroxyalkanoate synthesis repressor PhaR [Hyphomicrobium sp.]